MTATIENPCYNEIDVAFKKLNITSHDINKSIPSSDEMLQTENSSGYQFCSRKERMPRSNFDLCKDKIYSIISELKVLEKKKSVYDFLFVNSRN